MWRYAIWFIIAAVFAVVLLGWCVYYWRSRKDALDDQEFEKERMEHDEKFWGEDGN